jgi:hypothetical protein
MKSFFVFLVTMIALPLTGCAQVPEIPDRRLQDIAMVTVLPNGQPVIIYNPVLCQQMGSALCGFYRAHEHCHVSLGHTIRQMWPQQRELEADCCAARNATGVEAEAAYRWFSSGGGTSPIHGFGAQRAARILACRS